jgi:hypothetical protein
MLISDQPIRVFPSDGYWCVDYGRYMVDGVYATLAEAITTATVAATREHRKLQIEATPS